jgi:hypothetical protein
MTIPTTLGLWPSIIALVGTLVTGGSIGVGFKAWLEHRRGMRKDSDEVAMGLVATLSERVASLEKESQREREICDANLAVLRHRLNNIGSEFEALLLLIEMAPEKAKEFVAKIKEMRARHAQTEVVEKVAVKALAVNGGQEHE